MDPYNKVFRHKEPGFNKWECLIPGFASNVQIICLIIFPHNFCIISRLRVPPILVPCYQFVAWNSLATFQFMNILVVPTGSGARGVVAKVSLDQGLFAPSFIVVFVSTISALNGHSLQVCCFFFSVTFPLDGHSIQVWVTTIFW